MQEIKLQALMDIITQRFISTMNDHPSSPCNECKSHHDRNSAFREQVINHSQSEVNSQDANDHQQPAEARQEIGG